MVDILAPGDELEQIIPLAAVTSVKLLQDLHHLCQPITTAVDGVKTSF